MDPASRYSEQEAIELARQASLEVAMSLTRDHLQRTRRLHLRWALVCTLALALGVGGGVIVERQAVVVPCVRALDDYRDGFTLLTKVVDTDQPHLGGPKRPVRPRPRGVRSGLTGSRLSRDAEAPESRENAP